MYNNQQSIILLLSIMYIYFISDLFIIINEGVNIKIVMRLCIPIFGNVVKKCVNKLSKYHIDFDDWWNSSMSTYKAVSYVFKFMSWIQRYKIHLNWDIVMLCIILNFFIFIILQIVYNFVMVFKYNLYYLFFSLLCSYSVFMKFSSSGVAFVTLFGKCVEMGSSIILSENLHRIDDLKDYCINNNSWMSYIVKIVIGYHGTINTDGEIMAHAIGKYVGTTYNECKKLYQNSIINTVYSVVDISKKAYSSLLYKKIDNT